MKYLIAQDWKNTSGNHAGMAHLCRLLNKHFPGEYTVIVKTIPFEINYGKNLIDNIPRSAVRQFYRKVVFPAQYKSLCRDMLKRLRPGDKVLLLEYCLPDVSQLELAQLVRRRHPEVRICALSHLTPSSFKYFDEGMPAEWAKYVDKLMTLGSSLSQYLIDCNVPKDKVYTGFHYVDSEYYHPLTQHNDAPDRITGIIMGNMQRDRLMVKQVCESTPDIDWIICKGRDKWWDNKPLAPNIRTMGYLDEDELRTLMDRADFSLNVMNDTVGSNVITTSMAMGLCMVCSDVGSIRDYCDESSALFCNNEASDFVRAVNRLHADRSLLRLLRKNAFAQSQRFSIDKVHDWFCNI